MVVVDLPRWRSALWKHFRNGEGCHLVDVDVEVLDVRADALLRGGNDGVSDVEDVRRLGGGEAQAIRRVVGSDHVTVRDLGELKEDGIAV